MANGRAALAADLGVGPTRGLLLTRRDNCRLLIAALLAAFATAACHESPATSRGESGTKGDLQVADLLASPATYNGQRVTVSGYFNLEYEGTALFARREDAAQHLVSKGVWLKVGWPVSEDLKGFGNAYVRVRGTFEASALGIAFKGTLREITNIERLPSGSATPGV